jgi:hypothetical protein
MMMMGPGQGTDATNPKGPSEAAKVFWLTSALTIMGVETTAAIWGFHTARKCRKWMAAPHRRTWGLWSPEDTGDLPPSEPELR